MKRFFMLFALFTISPLVGFYSGVGVGWNSIDEAFKSDLFTSEDKSGQDRYDTHMNRLVPMITVGHKFFSCDGWVVDISAEWKYLNYRTTNVNSSRGQILPNASFSSKNIFGDDVVRDFTSKTCLNNEVVLLGGLGRELCTGSLYLGIGPFFLNGSNSIFVTAVHTPNGVGDHLISTSVKKRKIVWGGAIQARYQFFFDQNYFIDIAYSYLQTGKHDFKNSVNAAVLNGSDTPGTVTLFLKRQIKFSIQELMISMNLKF